MEAATVKGPIFIGAKKWIQKNLKPGDWERFIKAVPPDDQTFWTTFNVMPISRVPGSIYSNMYEAFTKLWDEDTFEACAGSVAMDDLGTFMRVFMKIGTPGLTLKGFPGAYRQYFSVGELKIIAQDDHGGEAELVGGDAYGKGGCCGTMGWTRKALEYAGAKQLKAWHAECKFKGQSRCLFKYTWA